MSSFLLESPSRTLVVPLSTSTRIGRHWSCDVVLTEESVPLYWLELRWRMQKWWWRALSAQDRTRAKTTQTDGDWQLCTTKSGPTQLLLPKETVQVTLRSDGPPELLVEDMLTRDRYPRAAVGQFLELWFQNQAWPLGVEPALFAPLRDGDIFIQHGRAYRLHLPTEQLDTVQNNTMDLQSPNCMLQIDRIRRRAVFSWNQNHAVIDGECVRAIEVYAMARKEGSKEGWLGTQEAFQRWQEYGGNTESSQERLGWERGRIRSILSEQNVTGLTSLFESRRVDNAWQTRLSLQASQIRFEIVSR